MAAGPGRDYDPHEEMAGMDRRNGRESTPRSASSLEA